MTNEKSIQITHERLSAFHSWLSPVVKNARKELESRNSMCNKIKKKLGLLPPLNLCSCIGHELWPGWISHYIRVVCAEHASRFKIPEGHYFDPEDNVFAVAEKIRTTLSLH